MKSTTLAIAIATFGLSSIVLASNLSYTQAGAICGNLGVMNVTNLPEGVNPSAVRTCKEHPEGGNQHSLEKRDCWFGNSPVGCSKNEYCYKSCAQPGSGEWCWTAENNGYGDWIRCNSASDCHTTDQCGAGGCKACGCSC